MLLLLCITCAHATSLPAPPGPCLPTTTTTSMSSSTASGCHNNNSSTLKRPADSDDGRAAAGEATATGGGGSSSKRQSLDLRGSTRSSFDSSRTQQRNNVVGAAFGVRVGPALRRVPLTCFDPVWGVCVQLGGGSSTSAAQH